jgi:uncharacterized protein (TIGR02646 family)
LKHILKKTEPPFILKSVAVSTYKELDNSEEGKKARGELRQALSQEQGYICCYCCQELDPRNSHIEHLRPQESYAHLSLDYTNLLVSCQGRLHKKEPRRCGMAKDDWFDEKLMVSPLSQDCERFFEYTLAGEILASKDPVKQQAAQETIDRLNLNDLKLQADRRAVFDEFFWEDLSLEDVAKLLKDFAETDANGHYQPFCPALTYLLRLEYAIL